MERKTRHDRSQDPHDGSRRLVETGVPAIDQISVLAKGARTVHALAELNTLSGDPRSVKTAREVVASRLGDRHPVLDTVVLLVSELVTNAIVHTESRNGLVFLLLDDRDQRVWVEVRDAGSDKRPVLRKTADESGRGLFLVDALSTRWGSYVTDYGGGAVWFEVNYQ